MTYQEYFKEKKEETLRLLNFYGDTKNKLTPKKEDLVQKIQSITLRLEEARSDHASKTSNLFESIAPIISFGFISEHPMFSFGFFPMLYAKELERLQEESSRRVPRKERQRAARRVKFLTKKKERLEKQEELVEERIEALEEVIYGLKKESVFWTALEGLAQGRLDVISEDTLEIGNSMSASFRGDLTIELFGTVVTPVDVAKLMMTVDNSPE